MLPFLADTITPAIASGFLYLFVINAAIGYLEGALLKTHFGGGRRSVWWMLLANYLSAWAGWFGLFYLLGPGMKALLGPRPIERINSVALAMVGISFAITLVVETGFVHLATPKAGRSLNKSLRASFCVNAVSYVITCLMFLWVGFSLPLNASVRPLADLGPLSPGTLYWVDPTGQVMARQLDHVGSDCKVGQVMLNDFAQPYQLRLQPRNDHKRVELDAEYSFPSYADRPTPPGIQQQPDPLVLADAGSADGLPSDYWNQDTFHRKSTVDLRQVGKRQTAVKFDWYRRYLDADVPGGPQTHLTIGFAVMDWSIEEPTVLPDEKIVFEWAGQIVLFDPHTRKIAFVALGTCPAFVPRRK